MLLVNCIQYHNKYGESISQFMAALHKLDKGKISERGATALLIITTAVAMVIGFIWA